MSGVGRLALGLLLLAAVLLWGAAIPLAWISPDYSAASAAIVTAVCLPVGAICTATLAAVWHHRGWDF